MNEGSLKGAGLPIGPLTGNDHRYVHAVPNGNLQKDYAIIRMQLGRLAVIEVERRHRPEVPVPIFRLYGAPFLPQIWDQLPPRFASI